MYKYKACAVYHDGSHGYSIATYATKEEAEQCCDSWRAISFVPASGKRLVGFTVREVEPNDISTPYDDNAKAVAAAQKQAILLKYMRYGKFPSFAEHWNIDTPNASTGQPSDNNSKNQLELF